IFLLSRSVTSAVPSGRNAMPHGTVRPLTSTLVATCVWSSSLLPAVEALGYGDSFGGEPSSSGGGGPNEQPARASIAAAAAARLFAYVRAFTGPRLALPDIIFLSTFVGGVASAWVTRCFRVCFRAKEPHGSRGVPGLRRGA